MARLFLRADLDELAAYRQGGGPQPGDTATFKLSSNENPFDPLPSVQARVAEALAGFNRYPDTGGRALAERIGARYAVRPTQVALGAGSVEIISQLIRATAGAGDEIVFPWRSFEAYPLLTIAAGARPVMVPLTPQFRHDFAAMRGAVTDRTRLIIVCSPNNPTDTSVAARELEKFLSSVPPRIVVVIDEAYLQFNRDPDAAVGREFLGLYPSVSSCIPSPKPTDWPGCGSGTRWRRSLWYRPCGRCRCRSRLPTLPRSPESRPLMRRLSSPNGSRCS